MVRWWKNASISVGSRVPAVWCHKPQFFCSLCTVFEQMQRLMLIRHYSLYSGFYRNSRLPVKEENSRWTVCLTLSLCNPFSWLLGPNMLRPRSMCPGRVPLLCGVGWVRVREPPGFLHGPVLWTWSFPGRHRNLQLWSQLDRPWLLYRWELHSNDSKHWQDSISQSSAEVALTVIVYKCWCI